ncbi:tubby-like F-box protein 5 [Nicotiana tomentosiformis]|uniref:tubby-like F-box protein 5 n=1 Tax=Nicotiana tomentosiformis TaxID=4098 RepID=UPI00051AFC32|nr:tubby-like F-box protein 5 [Nicotiana tomentosiformis]XP_009610595.1 tubby-like F-box protein 5 [Nicotiana tomentosiformis]XP_009610596.1 tubby-like F-box protein 5 [Nicotiana tomentosiformis]XP_009610598.1 tubby-like F-box protein 5 [Nicotiana tomentosiformis]XP_009610599.1 tubby-like F-box protein 5 [Nicotiana tomentosiformis]XP_018628984.1 tubby-like F-box protein 5 [Nicotiana tomentosiformis]XP_033514090.1 tubby-like F-box protein 5 [Nicotiana tomentosiformis]XP_033514091.1 tubby-like
MSFKSIVRELREMKDGIGSISRRGMEGRRWRNRTRSHIAPEVSHFDPDQQGQWANLPSELLLDIIRRVEESETSWPARTVVVFCASVCKSWREVTKEIVKTPEECGRLTFPISLKQPGPRESPIHCFIKRDRANSVYRLYFGLTPSEDESDKLLLAAKRTRRATSTEFVISLVGDDFSRASSTYVGKLRSNFLGTKFIVYDSQPPSDAAIQHCGQLSRRFSVKQVSPTVPACNYSVATINYELNVLRTRGPRRMHCAMHSIPFSSIQKGGSAPTPKSFPQSFDEKSSPPPVSKSKEPIVDISLPGFSSSTMSLLSREPLVLKNKAPRWHEQLQCWCLNFKGRVTVASVKNFQLATAVDPSQNIPVAVQETVILQFGKIGKDIFTMDYCYPLSAFQAFAICLSSFDTKPACE